MSVATVEKVLSKFLESKEPEALALKGAWGVGKTHFLNDLIKRKHKEIPLQSYSYVSLFGINSIKELRNAIFTKTIPCSEIGTKASDIETFKKNWLSVGKSWVKKSLPHAKELLDGAFPYAKNLTVGIELILPFFISNTILCLDDFERVNDSKFADEVLGFISELKTEKNCKVILIFNDEKLGEKEEKYKLYREKVIDIELEYSPTAIEAASIGLDGYIAYSELIKRYTLSLNIKNIRVIRKIASMAALIHKEVEALNVGVFNQAIHTLVLLSWCFYEPDEKRPTIDFIKGWNNMAWYVDKENQDDPKIAEWAKQINDYGLTDVDEFDMAIFNVIEKGYVEESGLYEEALKLDVKFKNHEKHERFTKAWRIFHDSFDDNTDELVNELVASLKDFVEHIGVGDLDSTVSLLRELGKDEVADELIDYVVEANVNNLSFFNFKSHPFALNDLVIKTKFTAKLANYVPDMSLIAAIQAWTDDTGDTAIQIRKMINASSDEYFSLFKTKEGKKFIKACLGFNHAHDPECEVAKKSLEAVKRIGEENPLNAIRIKRYL